MNSDKGLGPPANPFVRYRRMLHAHERWLAVGGTDAEFVELVESLDAAIGGVEGHGFAVTPVAQQPALAAAVAMPDSARLWVKDETNNVGGSHKARHLFGLLLHAAVDAHRDQDRLIGSEFGELDLFEIQRHSALAPRLQPFHIRPEPRPLQPLF